MIYNVSKYDFSQSETGKRRVFVLDIEIEALSVADALVKVIKSLAGVDTYGFDCNDYVMNGRAYRISDEEWVVHIYVDNYDIDFVI